MKAFAVFVCFLFIASAPVAAQTPVDVELVLAADGSGSIDDAEFLLQRQGYAAAIADPLVVDAIKSGRHGAIALAFVEWGAPDSQEIVVPWAVIRDQADAERFAAALLAAPRKAYGYNSISNALDFSAELIRGSPFHGIARIIDISGDGPQINGQPLAPLRDRLEREGITVNALAIKSRGGGYPGPSGEPLEVHFRNDVIAGFGAFVMTVNESTDFANVLRAKMIREIADGQARSPDRQARLR